MSTNINHKRINSLLSFLGLIGFWFFLSRGTNSALSNYQSFFMGILATISFYFFSQNYIIKCKECCEFINRFIPEDFLSKKRNVKDVLAIASSFFLMTTIITCSELGLTKPGLDILNGKAASLIFTFGWFAFILCFSLRTWIVRQYLRATNIIVFVFSILLSIFISSTPLTNFAWKPKANMYSLPLGALALAGIIMCMIAYLIAAPIERRKE